MNNIQEKLESLFQYLLNLIEKVKGYVDHIIDFFTMLRDRIEGFLEYIEEKLQGIGSVIEDLKHQEVAA